VNRGTILLFLGPGHLMGVGGSAPRPGKEPVPIVQEAGRAPGPVWTGGKFRPHRDSIPDHPVRSLVTIPTELPDPQCGYNINDYNLR